MEIKILELSSESFSALPESTRMALELKLSSPARLTSLVEVQQRVLEFVHINSLNNRPLRLANINRRFSKALKDHSSSMSECIEFLASMDELVMRTMNGSTVIASKRVAINRQEANLADGDSQDEIQKAEDRFWAQAQ